LILSDKCRDKRKQLNRAQRSATASTSEVEPTQGSEMDVSETPHAIASLYGTDQIDPKFPSPDSLGNSVRQTEGVNEFSSALTNPFQSVIGVHNPVRDELQMDSIQSLPLHIQVRVNICRRLKF
jgi:hypothetical protein